MFFEIPARIRVFLLPFSYPDSSESNYNSTLIYLFMIYTNDKKKNNTTVRSRGIYSL